MGRVKSNLAYMFKEFPSEVIYGVLAMGGGVARYLLNYQTGIPFRVGSFVSSVFVSGFSGYMFALAGISMNLPEPLLFMMAGCGGFFADQTMKLIFDILANKVKP